MTSTEAAVVVYSLATACGCGVLIAKAYAVARPFISPGWCTLSE